MVRFDQVTTRSIAQPSKTGCMDEFVEFVARGLVDDPDSVSVTTVERGGMSVIELRVAPADVGKVIGRRGTTIQAVRSLVQVGGAKAGRRCTVDLVED